MRDPSQYAKFAAERSRPFFELLARVPQRDFAGIVDLGCGSGELTASLSERWPGARVLGLDNSAAMLARAPAAAGEQRLEFRLGNIGAFDEPADLLLSNAALQWLDDHAGLFPRLLSLVKPGGALAVQMPFNFEQPSHETLEQIARSPRWAAKLAGWRKMRVEPLQWYVDILVNYGLQVDAWQTTYYQVLQGADPVYEWVKGTTLQPILALLDEADRASFSAEYAQALRQAYPSSEAGTIFPFSRIFFVAEKDL